MLDRLARGGAGGTYTAGQRRPPMLNEVFARVVSDGWAPRSVAGEDELAHLESSMARGTCLEPLIAAGDTVYVDRNAKPQPGDLVSFAMSQRLADLQNADPPPGQSPTWKKGDPWLKLYAVYHGIEFLFERYGSSMTATLAACESPDEVPILHPVRNVRRAGKLLFALPDVFASQVGLNAASQLGSAVTSGTVTVNAGVGGLVQDVDVVSIGIVTTGSPIGIDISSMVEMFNTSTAFPVAGNCWVTIRRDGSDIGTARFDAASTWTNFNVSRFWQAQVTLTVVDTPSAGAHTYALHIHSQAGGGSGNFTIDATDSMIKVREYKR